MQVRCGQPTVRLVVVLDCLDPDKLADFWVAALEYDREPLSEPYIVLKPRAGAVGPELVLQRVPEPKMTKNRMHLDMRIDNLASELDRLTALGASRLGDEIYEASFHWYVMADPEGNEFCVCQESRTH